eukprot:2158788-Pyramimonas_sp.AAC.1
MTAQRACGALAILPAHPHRAHLGGQGHTLTPDDRGRGCLQRRASTAYAVVDRVVPWGQSGRRGPGC